jgi:8-oxo-dGTP pyrophosphatase MutT (NUDIX family)
MSHIRAKSVCVFQHKGKVLLAEGFDPAKKEPYLSPVGGGIEFGERSLDAAIREVKEELNTDAHQLVLLGVVENLFIYDRKEGHEIVFIYEGKFKDESLYREAVINGVESNGQAFEARWHDLDGLRSNQLPVYPNGLIDLLRLPLAAD